MSATRGERDASRADLLQPIEEALGGRVVLENGRFYVALLVEKHPDRRSGTTFFALGRREGQGGIVVERGDALADLRDTPILDAFVALHDREREAFASDGCSA